MSDLPAPLPDPSQPHRDVSQPQSPSDSLPQDPHLPPTQSVVGPHDSPRTPTPAIAMANAAAEGLPDHQRSVMIYLAAGHGIAKAAHLGKVNRKTVYRWLKDDAHFCAVYNAWRKELEQSAKTRLLAMADDAIDTIHSAILTGHVNASLTVAKSMGFLTKPRIGPDDPDRIAIHRRARKMRQTARDLRAIEDARRELPYNHPASHTPEEWARIAEQNRLRDEETRKEQQQEPQWRQRLREARASRRPDSNAPSPQPPDKAPADEQMPDIHQQPDPSQG